MRQLILQWVVDLQTRTSVVRGICHWLPHPTHFLMCLSGKSPPSQLVMANMSVVLLNAVKLFQLHSTHKRVIRNNFCVLLHIFLSESGKILALFQEARIFCKSIIYWFKMISKGIIYVCIQICPWRLLSNKIRTSCFSVVS